MAGVLLVNSRPRILLVSENLSITDRVNFSTLRASMGLSSMFLANELPKDSIYNLVIAYEPSRELLEQMEKTISANGVKYIVATTDPAYTGPFESVEPSQLVDVLREYGTASDATRSLQR